MRLYIAVLDEFPDHMTPTLVAHAMLGAHLVHAGNELYDDWISNSFKKCVVRVNQKEFNKIAAIPGVYLGHENKTLGGIKSCAIPVPCRDEDLPNVLKFAKLWKPVQVEPEPPRQGYISPEFLAELKAYGDALGETQHLKQFLELYRK